MIVFTGLHATLKVVSVRVCMFVCMWEKEREKQSARVNLHLYNIHACIMLSKPCLTLSLCAVQVEKRRYEKAAWACITMREETYEQSICAGFMKIMRFICQQNSLGEQSLADVLLFIYCCVPWMHPVAAELLSRWRWCMGPLWAMLPRKHTTGSKFSHQMMMKIFL